MSIGRMILTGKQIEVLGVGEGEGCFSATFFLPQILYGLVSN